MIKSLCVFCGSNPGINPLYLGAADLLAKLIVERNIRLVYGGASFGLMGRISNKVMEFGGEVIGVIPESLFDLEIPNKNITKLHIVKNMHERKRMFNELSDSFLTLPGGFGTLEEFFELLSHSKLGYHHKPIGLYNCDGFYDKLLEFLDHVTEQDFVAKKYREMIIASNNLQNILDQFDNFKHPHTL